MIHIWPLDSKYQEKEHRGYRFNDHSLEYSRTACKVKRRSIQVTPVIVQYSPVFGHINHICPQYVNFDEVLLQRTAGHVDL